MKNCDLTLFSSRRRPAETSTQFFTQLLLRSQSHPELVFGFRFLRIWLFVFYEQHPPAERSQPAAVRQGKPWTTLLRDGMQKYLVLRRLKTTLSVIRCCRFFFLKRGKIIGGLIKSLLHRTVLPVTLNVLRFTAGIHCARWHLSFRKHGMTNPHKRFVGSCTQKRNSDRVLAFQST